MAHGLRRLGYRTYRSAMHANVGCTQDAADALEQRIETITARRGRKVSIVGHSLGGLLARAVARRPDLVRPPRHGLRPDGVRRRDRCAVARA
jgi:triacylglycerol lipase